MPRDIGDVSTIGEVTADYLVRIVDNPNTEYPTEKLIPGTDLRPASVPSDITGAALRFDPRLSVYNMHAGNTRKIGAALARIRSGVGTAEILCAGESTVHGSGATNVLVDSFPAWLRTILTSNGFPSNGTGICYPRAANVKRDDRWTFDANWTLGAGSLYYGAVFSGATASFTSDVSGTVAKLFYFNAQGGTFDYTIDGGAPVTVTPTGANTLGTVTVSGLADRRHTFTITTNSASSVYITGASVSNGSGIAVTNAGLPGVNTVVYVSLPVSGGYLGTTLAASPSPDLTILDIGINDGATQTVATYTANLLTIVAAYKAVGDVLLCVPNTVSTGTISLATWTTFRQAIYDVAEQLDVPLIDLGNIMGTYAQANANSLMADTSHPNGSGYNLIARSLADAIFATTAVSTLALRRAGLQVARGRSTGRAWTVNPALCGQSTSVVTSNRAWYLRIPDSAGFVDGVTQLRISIGAGTSSGNISVGVYRNTGTGIAARPGTRKATTGAIACPAAGTSAVTLTTFDEGGTSVPIEAGDWLALAADNTTVTFARAGTIVANLDGLVQYEAAAHPVPATATPLTTASPMPFYIEAVAP